MRSDARVEELNKTLMAYLESRSSKALGVISELKNIGMETGDDGLIGYAYYRYAYYYYFTNQDMKKFRRNLQKAISYLLRSNNREYLVGSYNLVAYDAQDLGMYDIAYAYFMVDRKSVV